MHLWWCSNFCMMLIALLHLGYNTGLVCNPLVHVLFCKRHFQSVKNLEINTKKYMLSGFDQDLQFICATPLLPPAAQR